ncbi:hypothetical protein [Streptacidiphilus rugosus]|uniref:hypothetical protein n=1 Tax=Streptacidiphilus rugosus TaxID=405783 RepID=UPI000565086C|nr:hypothetical protein [Streptacidiphilus rugosus]
MIAAGATVGVWLAGSALGAWREERAGQVYELTPRYLGAALRAVAAALALACALAGGVFAAGSGGQRTVADSRALSSAEPGSTPGANPGGAAARASSGSGRGSSGSASDRVHAASAPLTAVGTSSGGRLLQGGLPGVPGQVRVWLPAQYAAHAAAPAGAAAAAGAGLQALVVRAPESELSEVWEGLAGAVAGGHANPFIAVAPADPCVLAGDDSALRRAVAAQFHVATRARSWAELGMDAGAACAATAELAHPDTYAGSVALGGTLPHPAAGSVPAGVRLLLAQAHRDLPAQAEANRLRAALTGAPDAGIRLSAVVRDISPDRERFRLVRMAANYLTEEFAAGAHR